MKVPEKIRNSIIFKLLSKTVLITAVVSALAIATALLYSHLHLIQLYKDDLNRQSKTLTAQARKTLHYKQQLVNLLAQLSDQTMQETLHHVQSSSNFESTLKMHDTLDKEIVITSDTYLIGKSSTGDFFILQGDCPHPPHLHIETSFSTLSKNLAPCTYEHSATISTQLLFADSSNHITGLPKQIEPITVASLPRSVFLNKNVYHRITSIPDFPGLYLLTTLNAQPAIFTTKIIKLFLALFAVIAIFSAGIGFQIYQVVIKRIKTLKKVIHKEWIDSRSLNSLQDKDEIGDLVNAFQKMSHQIDHRAEIEQLASQISRELAGLNTNNFHESLHSVLKHLGIFLQLDRTYLIMMDHIQKEFDFKESWLRAGMSQWEINPDMWHKRNLPWLKHQLMENRPIVYQSIEELPEEAIEERQFWGGSNSNHSIHSLIIYPFFIKGNIAGFIGGETFISTMNWMSADSQLLQMVSEICGYSIERLETSQMMDEQNAQLIQAQKMETIGHLAGGIAHDFNNILAGIVSSTSLFKSEYQDSPSIPYEEIRSFLDTVEKAGIRASAVVQQLLGLSRRQEFNFVPFDLNNAVRQAVDIGYNSFDKSVKIILNLTEEKAFASIDPIQIEQVLLNFMVNGVHAMTVMRDPGVQWGGTLTISTSRQQVDPEFRANHPIAFEPNYWQITIEDTGVGIPEDFYEKVFDPFFTTKEKGIGTGLGLSMIYRIVQEHYGFVEFESKLGVGTLFHIYLPILEMTEQDLQVEEPLQEAKEPESATVLVVDDEPMLRKIASRILNNLGHTVLLAEDGGEAIDIYSEKYQDIDLVILDLVMPVLSGRETYIALKEINPKLKVIISSGFRKDERVDEMIELGAHHFLQKPYTVDEMRALVNKTLNQE